MMILLILFFDSVIDVDWCNLTADEQEECIAKLRYDFSPLHQDHIQNTVTSFNCAQQF